MNAEQKLKHLCIIKACELGYASITADPITAENIDEVWDELTDSEDRWDAMSETREGEVETEIPCEHSRHYESKSVAAQYLDGSWIGWTYWYGGGKHGEPETIDWMDSAYDLTCTEEEKLVTVRAFAKTQQPEN